MFHKLLQNIPNFYPYPIMKTKREFTAVAVLLLATTLTLITAVEHHKNIAIVYGQIANLFVPLITLSSFILGAFISLIFQWGINVIQFEKVARLLPADESAVMKLLFNKRTLTQTDLSSETGLSRLIVSRIVSRLEDKGIVNKKPLANTNF